MRLRYVQDSAKSSCQGFQQLQQLYTFGGKATSVYSFTHKHVRTIVGIVDMACMAATTPALVSLHKLPNLAKRIFTAVRLAFLGSLCGRVMLQTFAPNACQILYNRALKFW